MLVVEDDLHPMEWTIFQKEEVGYRSKRGSGASFKKRKWASFKKRKWGIVQKEEVGHLLKRGGREIGTGEPKQMEEESVCFSQCQLYGSS